MSEYKSLDGIINDVGVVKRKSKDGNDYTKLRVVIDDQSDFELFLTREQYALLVLSERLKAQQ